MFPTIRTFRLAALMTLAAGLLAGPARAADEKKDEARADAHKADAAKSESGGKKKVVFLAGGPSHGFGAHDHKSGCHILAKRINEVPGFTAVVHQGWPKDSSIFDGAAAVVMYSDGGGGHFAIKHIKELDALHEKGVGIGAIHYAVEVPKGEAGEHWLKWMGGYFETNWSVNPHWNGVFSQYPQHPVAGGLKPFVTNDEWYYNMRFRENKQGVTPVLSAVPPDSTRQGKDSSHGGNPEVRKGIGKNQAEHVLWLSENENGSRGFGTTGGHVHWNWANDQFRKAVLNSVVWIAKGNVPADGVESNRPDVEEMLANHDENVPEKYKQPEEREKLAKKLADVNNPPKLERGTDANKPQAAAPAGGELLYEVSVR